LEEGGRNLPGRKERTVWGRTPEVAKGIMEGLAKQQSRMREIK